METMFETARLVVRRFREDDAQALYENHLDGEVRKWFPNECYADREEALDAISFFGDCVNNGHLPYVLGVELKETGELIGDTGISEVEGRDGNRILHRLKVPWQRICLGTARRDIRLCCLPVRGPGYLRACGPRE